MTGRTGEKIGWTAGWLGGFIWVAILSVVLLFQGKWLQGLLGMLLTAIAVVVIVSFAPWRFPSTRYWKLMLAPYTVFFLSVPWAVWAYGGVEPLGLNWWNLLWILPVLIPLGSLSNRRWADSNAQPGDARNTAKPPG